LFKAQQQQQGNLSFMESNDHSQSGSGSMTDYYENPMIHAWYFYDVIVVGVL
jgi:hypothetical protein